VSDTILLWSFPLAVAVHNLEEAVWLPRWSERSAGRWHRRVGAVPFRFAVAVLTVLVFAIAVWAQAAGVGSFGHYLLAAYAVGQAVNVVFPHAIATVATRTYAPGLLTGLFLVLPSAAALVAHSLSAGQLRLGRLAIVTVAFSALVIASIPLLFRLGSLVEAAVAGRADRP